MRYIIFFVLLTNCSIHDYDINPATTIVKQLIKGNYESSAN